jgi:serine/threonine-protein kinase
MIKLGMIIGDRYVIMEKIGTGGMSDVYKAKDQKLNRLVAVKVLKQEFSENRNFVSKFRVEAQAAAGLMHPNIVNVYDVGEENGIHYIVMELVEGITLKKYIEKKSRLTTKEAISIAIQVAMGIEAAHNNHIIHRDIKPQNIIISKEGKVKVTDFGIAKAASSNTITSNVMGSVHYTSPEQARGGFSDEKSDIYSMGITIFEMLTGRVPFNGDTTVTIAIKHIQDPMPSIREFVPEVPVSVENIVMKCTQKSPDRRYQNMGEVIRDLKYSLVNPDAMIAVVDENDDAGKTKISNGAVSRQNYQPTNQEGNYNSYDNYDNYNNYDNGDNGGYDNYEGEQDEQFQAPPVLNTVWEDRVPKKDEYLEEDNYKPSKKKKAKTNTKKTSAKKTNTKAKKTNKNNNYDTYDDYNYSQDAMNRNKVRQDDLEFDEEFDSGEYYYNPKAEGVKTFLTIIAAVVIGLILLYFVAQATGVFEQISNSVGNGTASASDAQRAVMPEFTDKDVDEVKEELNSAGLGCKTKYVESTQYSKNRVIAAALEDGTMVLANDKILLNTTIVLTVSAGANGIEVPSVIGYSEAEGTAALTNAGFSVTKTSDYSAEYAKGTIISQSPEGNSVAPIETEIAIVISLGADGVEVKMPTVTGQSEEAAISTIEAAGLTVGNVEPSYSSDYPEGQVCYQSYAAGTTVASGAIVDLKISIGVETVTYNCNVMVEAPSDYTGGNAEVILTTADGTTQLWYSQNVTSFPVSINLNGFTSPSAYGIVTISYFRNTETLVTDADGNMTTQVTPTLAQTQQNVQFTQN